MNAALARAASEERKRRKLEEAERIRLEAEAKKLRRTQPTADQAQDLANYNLNSLVACAKFWRAKRGENRR